MASAPLPNPCVKCPKGRAQTMCSGCQQWFCVKHFNEHRQNLTDEMEHLSQQHNELHQDFDSPNNNQNPLFIRINNWEQRSIERIRQVANEVRQNLEEHLNTNKRKLQRSVDEITIELRSSRDNEDYTEIELQKWLNQLKELRQRLFHPPTVQMSHDGDDLSKKIPFIKLWGEKLLFFNVINNNNNNKKCHCYYYNRIITNNSF